MGFLTGFVGGMAGAYNDDRDAEKLDARKKQLAEYESQLQMNRMVMQETLREKFKQAEMKAKRDQDVADGKTVQEGSEAKRVERAQGIINADTGLNYSPDEVKKIIADPKWVENYGARHDTETGKPTEWTEGGLINQRTSLTPSTDRTRAQELNDKADAAMGIGRTDMEKGFRDQGNLERQVAGDEAKGKRMEEQTAAQKRTNEIREKEVDARAGYQDRMAGAAEARAAAAERRASGGDGKLGREERLKYTSLFAESGRRMSDTQKSMSTITKALSELTKYNAGQPDTPEITEARDQLKSLKGDYDAYKEERSTYQSLLAGTDGKESAAKPDPAPKPAPDADKFVPGKKYKDAKGNVATYMGNGKWN